MSVIFYIVISGILGVTGQLILKRALISLGPLVLLPDTLVNVVLRLALEPLVVLGLLITVAGTFFWLIALSRVDLSYAYPFASLNYVLVLLASWWLFGELPSVLRLIGVVAIMFGVWTISRTPQRTTAGDDGRAPAPVRALGGEAKR